MSTQDKKKIVEEHFDEIFTGKPEIDYQFNVRKMGAKDRQIVKNLQGKGVAGKKCLDIGPGTGRWLKFLKNHNPDYLAAVDISDESLRRCQDLCDSLEKIDLENDRLPYEDNFFDWIISFEVLEHIKEPHNYIAEMARVIKPGGYIFLSTPNLISLMSRFRMFVGMLPFAIASDKTHVRFYRQKDARKLLNKYGLEPQFLPSAIALNPFDFKSLRFPSCRLTSNFDDGLLFIAQAP